MDQSKRDPQRDPRQMGQEGDRDMDLERNEEETGKPVQIDEGAKEHRGGAEHQPDPPGQPESEHTPDQGQHGGR
jgi:hypothetical protein